MLLQPSMQLIHQLNWLVIQIGPDMSYDLNELSPVVKQEISDYIKQVFDC